MLWAQQMQIKLSKLIKLSNIIICLGILIASNSVVYAAKKNQNEKLPIEANAMVDKTLIHIGDKFTYKIIIKAPKNIEFESPQLLSQDLPNFAIKDFGSSQKGIFGKKTYTQWYLLDTYISGEQTIPAKIVKYRPKGQTEWQELNIKELKINVKSVLNTVSAKTSIHDIRGPKKIVSKFWIYFGICLLIVLIAIIIIGVIVLKQKKQNYKIPPIPAHIIAYTALSALEKKDYISQGLAKDYYAELSDIIRHYLENRFNIRAPEMTTEEFLIKVREDNTLAVEHKTLLRDFLANCDLVKFAEYKPPEQKANLSFESAKNLVDQTKLTLVNGN